MSKDLEDTIKDELLHKVKKISKRIDRIINDLQELSSDAIQLSIYFDMSKKIPITDLAQLCDMKPAQVNELKRACRLTKNSPQINRSLLNRFDIIP